RLPGVGAVAGRGHAGGARRGRPGVRGLATRPRAEGLWALRHTFVTGAAHTRDGLTPTLAGGGEDRCEVSFLDILLPVRCVVCAAGGEQLCAGCRESLPLLRPPLCERCGAPTAWPVSRCRECSGRRLAFASARAAVEYDDGVRRLVAAWKERGLRRLAGEAADLVVARVERPGVAALTFVPPDRA